MLTAKEYIKSNLQTLGDYYNFLNELYPFSLQDEWDNSGVQIGIYNFLIIQNPILATDLTVEVIEFAEENNSNLIITHHPLVLKHNSFQSVAEISLQTEANYSKEKILSSGLARALIQSQINHIALHTNLDKSHFGVADVVSRLIGITKDLETVEDLSNTNLQANLQITNSKLQQDATDEYGFLPSHGRVGCLKEPLKLETFLESLQKIMQLNQGFIQINTDDLNQEISKVAVLPGSGESMINQAFTKAEVIITSDIKHHPITDINNYAKLTDNNVIIINVPHCAIEGLVFSRCKTLEGLPTIANLLPNAIVAPMNLSMPWKIVI